MAGKRRAGEGVTIIIRREEGGEHGHHGGAWKVAYADFVTAMMAFFLLMWLLNATSEEQRRGIADYFSPHNVLARTTSGSGEPFGGRTANSEPVAVSDNGAVRVERGQLPPQLDLEQEGESAPEGIAETEQPPRTPTATSAGGGASDATKPAAGLPADVRAEVLGDEELRAELAKREKVALERAAEDIRAAVRDDPALAELARQLVVEQVPEGLRIQILDADRRPMFPVGGVAPNDRARALLQKVIGIASRLPNGLAIAGHTDATPFRGADRSNWELSADRANAVRRILVEGGINEARLQSVTGHADRNLLLPNQPNDAANRRVAITVLRQMPESAAP